MRSLHNIFLVVIILLLLSKIIYINIIKINSFTFYYKFYVILADTNYIYKTNKLQYHNNIYCCGVRYIYIQFKFTLIKGF